MAVSCRYDKNGSIISEGEEGRRSEYRYDLLNRQTYVRTLDGREQENLYDGENLRAGVTENGKKTTFLYHNGEILTEFEGESAPVRRHIRGIGLSCVQTTQDNTYHSYHQDEQGSTAYITGRGRETENIYQYDAFGNLIEQKETVTNRVLYTGQQYDQETGQYYLRARYYNSVVGRFLQEDTYRGDGLNLYTYCVNNPAIYYDPSGHVEVTYGDGGLLVQNETPAGEAVNKGGNNPCIDGAINNGQPLNDHRVVPNSEANKLPVTGVPNSSADLLNPDSSVKQRRYYDEDGKAQMDIDFNHTDDGTHEFPHTYIWEWTKKPPRQ